MPSLDVDPLAHLRPGDNGEPVRAELRASPRFSVGGCRRRHRTLALVCCRAWGHPGAHIALRAAAVPSQRRLGPCAVAAVWPGGER